MLPQNIPIPSRPCSSAVTDAKFTQCGGAISIDVHACASSSGNRNPSTQSKPPSNRASQSPRKSRSTENTSRYPHPTSAYPAQTAWQYTSPPARPPRTPARTPPTNPPTETSHAHESAPHQSTPPPSSPPPESPASALIPSLAHKSNHQTSLQDLLEHSPVLLLGTFRAPPAYSTPPITSSF